MNKTVTLLLSFVMAAGLVGCGGGGGGGGGGEPAPVLVVPADVTLAASPATTAAAVNVPFTFSAGVPELGTTGETTLAFTSTSSTPTFSIVSGGNTATGTTTFGSCIFKVTASTFPAGHRLAVDQEVTINPCNIKLDTQGAPADSVARQEAAVFILGSAVSTDSTVTVTVNPGGSITINGQAAGTVTLVPVTG